MGNSPGPVNSPHNGPVTRKMFPFDDVIMCRQRDMGMGGHDSNRDRTKDGQMGGQNGQNQTDKTDKWDFGSPTEQVGCKLTDVLYFECCSHISACRVTLTTPYMVLQCQPGIADSDKTRQI